MSWKVKNGRYDAISESHGLARPVEVLGSEVLAAQHGPLTGLKSFSPQGAFPLLPPLSGFGKP